MLCYNLTMENEDKQISYDYIVNSGLMEKDFGTIESVDFENIYICAYHINTSARCPFLRYMLCPESETGELNFQKVDMRWRYNLLSCTTMFLSGLLNKESSAISFKGFYEFAGSLYLFFDVSNIDIDCIDDIYAQSEIRFGLLDEIVNYGHICGIMVAKSLTRFFTQNDSLLFLYEKSSNAPYEVPQVAFVGKSTENKLKFVSIFGESAQNKEAILGPYYYFTNFENAMKESNGIVRFAVFTGQTKHLENLSDDPCDDSVIKAHLVRDCRDKVEIMTCRISDHDGLWTRTYDSVYLANMEMDDGTLLPNTPMLVVKEYNQQVPLSYHYVNKLSTGIC